MASTEKVMREAYATRRNAFTVEPAYRPMPSKERAADAERIRPSVSHSVAQIAGHLSENPVFVELFDTLKREAVDKLMQSPLGIHGTEARELARYELEALETIRNRIASMAAEIRLHDGDE